MFVQNVEFDKKLLEKYNIPCPRYTSYPTAKQFSDTYSEKDHINNLLNSNKSLSPISLYFHIPFCSRLCYYCACNKVHTKKSSKASTYLQYLHKEIELQSKHLDKKRPVTQLHWGGGTPTFISHNEIIDLMQKIRLHFNLLDHDRGEYAIEVDTRTVTIHTIDMLRKLGFNKISLGIQDFDHKVQEAVNRSQSEAHIIEIFNRIRLNKFNSICLELIYGLPFQTVLSFEKTITKTIELNPDRISLYSFAYLPEQFTPQKKINKINLPSPKEKLDLLQMSISKLNQAGYVNIGMDHFAKKEDQLAIAQRKDSLYRNFQGYSTHSQCDLIAMGASGISHIGMQYAQNVINLNQYYDMIDHQKIPIAKGIIINKDDQIRKLIIHSLICHFSLRYKEIESLHKELVFKEYFKSELIKLKHYENDKLVILSKDSINITPKGRLLIRNICSVFDKYYTNTRSPFSKAI
ncbi:MAG TPA: oxygen-independent coproporphyrinogen III oxidase [Gammaproteobacteria bacterium]|nr:oxygen-independent coproporphyrinogen III oxidase [Gammaproteobacteria bacterium]